MAQYIVVQHIPLAGFFLYVQHPTNALEELRQHPTDALEELRPIPHLNHFNYR